MLVVCTQQVPMHPAGTLASPEANTPAGRRGFTCRGFPARPSTSVGRTCRCRLLCAPWRCHCRRNASANGSRACFPATWGCLHVGSWACFPTSWRRGGLHVGSRACFPVGPLTSAGRSCRRRPLCARPWRGPCRHQMPPRCLQISPRWLQMLARCLPAVSSAAAKTYKASTAYQVCGDCNW